MATHAGGARTAPPGHRAPETLVGGWTAFAASLMAFGGLLAVFAGIAAIAEDEVFVSTPQYAFEFDLTGWGVIHLVLGALITLTGLAVLTGRMWARVAGVVLAGLAMISNFMWLPRYPLWALALLAIDTFIIWALCAPSRRPTP